MPVLTILKELRGSDIEGAGSDRDGEGRIRVVILFKVSSSQQKLFTVKIKLFHCSISQREFNTFNILLGGEL